MNEDKKARICLAGNPNCGKTTLFNSLTGATAYVGNWPGVTVEKRSGTYNNKKTGVSAEIVDLPGIYSLSPYSPEEVISRNYILDEKPDCVINVIDSTNLERNLYMTTQILEMDVPVVLALNMSDALKDNGMSIDAAGISKKLGVPVVSISALRRKNLDELVEVAVKEAKNKRKGKSFWKYGDFADSVKKAEEIYRKEEIENPLFHAMKALEGDEIEQERNQAAFAKVQSLGVDSNTFEASSADARYKFITKELSTLRQGAPLQEARKMSKSDKVDKILTNKWIALPLLLILFFVIFHLTFAADLFYLKALGVSIPEYPGFITLKVGSEEVKPFAGLFSDGDGIASIGEIFHRLAGDNETGIQGLIIQSFKMLLINWSAPEWLIQFFCDGVFAGVAAVLGFVPQIMILFMFFAIMEDSGYMARVAFVLDRIFRKFGVSGRAFLPMIMGFGCSVPAMINTRTLASDKERVKTIRVIPYFTCGAKAEILTMISAAVAVAFNWRADLFTFGMYVTGMVLAIVIVIMMNKTTQREELPPFIMELPSYHLPQPKALGIHVWDKGKHFIKKAFTIIFVSTIVIWFFQSFTWDWHFIPSYEGAELAEIQALGYSSYEVMEASSILASIGKIVQPLFTPIGFGAQVGANGWVYGVATVQGIVAKEAVTSTLETLSGIVGATDSVEAMFAATGITAGGVMGFTIFNLFTIPCFASVATAKGELTSKKDYLWTILFWLLGAYVIAALFYVVTESVTMGWGLAAAIAVPLAVVAAIVLLFVGIHFYDKRMRVKEEMAQ